MTTTIDYCLGKTTAGEVLVASGPNGICAILLGDKHNELVHELQQRFPAARLTMDGDSEQHLPRVTALINMPEAQTQLPLDIHGTAFQQQVWQALRDIPAGTTVSYSDIAQGLGKPKAVRAVAKACAANKLAVAIPCHRVVRSDGNLSGYRWGVERKRLLLENEAKART